MQQKEMAVSVFQKINLGNYENRDYGITMTVTLEPNDDPQAVKNQLVKKLEQFIDFEVKKFTEKQQGDGK